MMKTENLFSVYMPAGICFDRVFDLTFHVYSISGTEKRAKLNTRSCFKMIADVVDMLLYSAILCSQADSLRSHVILYE